MRLRARKRRYYVIQIIINTTIFYSLVPSHTDTGKLDNSYIYLYTVLLQEDIYVLQIIIHSTNSYDLVPRRLRAQAHILRHTEYYI